MIGRDRLSWRRAGNVLTLHYGKSRRPLAYVEPDAEWGGMFRVRSACGGITDMVNLSRAKDAAASIALVHLNLEVQETATEAPPVRRKGGAGISLLPLRPTSGVTHNDPPQGQRTPRAIRAAAENDA